jgi:hypothetical protein
MSAHHQVLVVDCAELGPDVVAELLRLGVAWEATGPASGGDINRTPAR